MDPSDAQPAPGQALSPSEVDHLVAHVDDQSSTAEKQNADQAQRFDFRQPSFLSASELRKLRLRHEEFVRSLAARLSIYLRLEFGLQLSKMETLSFQTFIESLSSPTHLTLFKVEPLRGVCLLDIPPRLGLTIVDRQLGGPAHCADAGRDLSEIEVGLLDQTIQIILSEWAALWNGVLELRPVILGHENNGRFLQTSPHDTVMLTIGIEARIGESVEQMQISFPYYTLEPLILKLNNTLESADKASAPPQAAPVKWNPALEEIKIAVIAEWPNLQLTARQFAQLRPGDVFPLAPQLTSQVQVRLAKVPKFIGNLGTRGGRWAVELTQVLKT